MKGWTTAKLGEICDVSIGRTPARNRPDFWGNGHGWLSIADMNQGRDLRTTKETITDLAIRECNCRSAQPGTLLLSFKLSIGKVGIARIPLYTNEAIAALPIQDPTRMCVEYLYWAIQSVDLTLGLDRAAKGLTLNKAKLLEIGIPLPPPSEQRRIADLLDRAEALRAKRRTALAQLDSLTQLIFLEMFGDPVANKRRWKRTELEKLADKITDGEHLNPDFSEYGMPIVMAGDVREEGIVFPQTKTVRSEDGTRFRRKCDPQFGDLLLVSRGATIGRQCIVQDEREFCLMGSVILIKPKREIMEPRFLSTFLRLPSSKHTLFKTSGSTAQQAIYLKDLKAIACLAPPIHLQREFTRRVEAVEKLKAAQRESLAEMDALFASLQHRAFRGEL